MEPKDTTSMPLAIWSLQLNTKCPVCAHEFDIVANDAEWFEYLEVGEERFYDTSCPNCGHEFTVQTQY